LKISEIILGPKISSYRQAPRYVINIYIIDSVNFFSKSFDHEQRSEMTFKNGVSNSPLMSLASKSVAYPRTKNWQLGKLTRQSARGFWQIVPLSCWHTHGPLTIPLDTYISTIISPLNDKFSSCIAYLLDFLRQM